MGQKQDKFVEATVKLKIITKFVIPLQKEMVVSALDHALVQALKDFPKVKDIRLLDFKVPILESNLGTDAITRVHIESTDGENMGTVGVSDNVITASWEALVDSVSYKIY